MSKSAEQAKTAWMAMLAAHRRPWAEWAELERRVAQRSFVTHKIFSQTFLYAGAMGDDPPLSRRIASKGAPVSEVGAPFPHWIAALVGLGCTDAGDLASAGVLAGDLWPERLRRLVTIEDWESAWHFDSLEEPLHSGPAFVLQSSRSGTPLFSDGVSVLGIVDGRGGWKLENVGKLDVFSRFCLRHSLRGVDWVDPWRRGDGESEGIRALEIY